MGEMPNWPAITCPDCAAAGRHGQLQLRPMPAAWNDRGGNRPWVYLCDQQGCQGKLSAHPDGSPVGPAVTGDVRAARRWCHTVFDPLWQQAHLMACYRDRLFDSEGTRNIRQAARHRAYCWLAAQLDCSEAEAHLGRQTLLPVLRRIYVLCRDATPEQIREWWYEGGGRERFPPKKERKHGKQPDTGRS